MMDVDYMKDGAGAFASRRPDVRSWGSSLLLHLAVVGMVGWGVPHEVAPIRDLPFQWDVVLVTSQEARASTPVPTAALSRPLRTPAPVPISRLAEGPPAFVEPPPAEPIHPIEPLAKPDPEPISAPRIAAAAEPLSPSILPPETEASPLASAVEDAMALPERDLPQPLAQASAAAQPLEPPPAAIPEAVPVQAAVTALREEEPLAPATSREQPVETGAKSLEPVPGTQPSQPVAVEEPVKPGSDRSGQMSAPAKADFGWLVQALWSKVAEHKRYPSEARMKRWQGKVVVRVVIDEHGHLLEARIASSSGHEALDEDAMAVITRSCPLALSQPLGQRQVVLRVPIQYRLDS